MLGLGITVTFMKRALLRLLVILALAGNTSNHAINGSPTTGSWLGNISTRAVVQTGDNVMIGGFIVQGTQPKRVIIRAIGPELSQYGVPDPLQDPTLELHDGTGALIGTNDNWQTTIIGGIITHDQMRSEEHTSELQSQSNILCRLLLEKKKRTVKSSITWLASNVSPTRRIRARVPSVLSPSTSSSNPLPCRTPRMPVQPNHFRTSPTAW